MEVKIPPTRGKTERPRGPLLQLDTADGNIMRRIGGRLGYLHSGGDGAILEIPPLMFLSANWLMLSISRTMSGG